ncbi:hypothetical protein POX_b02700 [Penicillium oxalicum]|uniref:hypothetical protein n=1 Tax=Penicillium oxalicum TaxID=69781 RepID=UPI0020B7F386|nr:hypothetical protein POX_b02700 [Penicillium oxalicum]KAI2792660.1 hypothetical protein POX_b02700 [Penicillium oxalicum]
MPDEARRIIIEKSSTVRRRYQRSNKRFKFTASQLRRIEREEELERRAQAIRDKEAKRRANKKKKAEKEAKDREERKKLGLPDPCVPKVPASQPLLSAFLGAKPAVRDEGQESPANESESLETEDEEPAEIEHQNPGGDTEAESDYFDDLDEGVIEQELLCFQDVNHSEDPPGGNALDDINTSKVMVGHEATGEDVRLSHRKHDDDRHDKEVDMPTGAGAGAGAGTAAVADDDDDEFSDCSVFNDVDIIQEADAIVSARFPPPEPIDSLPSALHTPVMSTMGPPQPVEQAQILTSPLPCMSDSFYDDTADYLEGVFSRGCGDSFSELAQLGSGAP